MAYFRDRLQIIANLNLKQLARWPIGHQSALSSRPMTDGSPRPGDMTPLWSVQWHYKWRNDQPMKSLNCLKFAIIWRRFLTSLVRTNQVWDLRSSYSTSPSNRVMILNHTLCKTDITLLKNWLNQLVK